MTEYVDIALSDLVVFKNAKPKLKVIDCEYFKVYIDLFILL